MRRIFSFAIFFSFFYSLNAYAASDSSPDDAIIISPDGNIRFEFTIREDRGFFSVLYKNVKVIEQSELYLSLNHVGVFRGRSIQNKEAWSANETYPVLGNHAMAKNHYNGMRIVFSMLKEDKTPPVLEIKAFNDGVAYRQLIDPINDKNTVDERTDFKVPGDAMLWYHDINMHYEGLYTQERVQDIKEGQWIAPPATFKFPGGCYMSITEAALLNYSGMVLQKDDQNTFALRLAPDQPTSYPYKLRYPPADTLRLRQPMVIEGRVTTPWRVMILGNTLNDMVNADIVTNLNAPPDKQLFPQGVFTGWIRPGRAVWKYLAGGGDGRPEVLKHFSDAASKLGFEHNILEGFWRRWSDNQIRDLVNYSAKKGVSIWFWEHSKNLRNPDSLELFLKRCHDLGVKGIKIDFFDSEAKEVVDLYERILKTAAKYQLLCDFHGSGKPTGLSRSYPNELVREAVKGMEASKLEDRATHETTIPFTRFLAGPAEYTVLFLGERRKNTTWAHQIASAAILSAPLLTYAANPDTLLANPAVEIIKGIPATWDETLVLPPSEIGTLAIYARRKGKVWYLAIMNGATAKRIQVPLNFLKGNYNALAAIDVPQNPAAVATEKKSYNNSSLLTLELPPGGGYIARFTK